jgi:hypothetical protein
MFGIERRGFVALTRALILMDLRGQHYARATATGPGALISPLFWVVAQCLFLSAVSSLILFARADVRVFVFVELSLSLLVMASTIVVEFHEIVLDPRDLEIIGPRPVTPRTYSAARFANLLFYVGLIYFALNLFPLLLGAGLRDAGPWYVPAYLIASLAGNLVVVAILILLLSLGAGSRKLAELKEVLAWTQIVLVALVFYGGQMLLRDDTGALLVWATFPPAWVEWLPSTWLAHFVEDAAVTPSHDTLLWAIFLTGLILIAVAAVVGRVSGLYRTMQPHTVTAHGKPMPRERIGSLKSGLSSWVARSAEERIGYWLARTLLARDLGLRMRCLWPFSLVVVVTVLGLASGQFANPVVDRDSYRITLSVLAFYLVALAVPPLIHNLTFSRESEAFWLLASSPLARPPQLARGVCKAVMLLFVTPICLLLGIIAAWAWHDPLSALLHAGLAWLLSWLLALSSLWLVVHDYPFACATVRGSSAAPITLSMAMLGAVVMMLGGLHLLFAGSPWFWVGAGAACVCFCWPLGRNADARLTQLWRLGA